jgi:hypothetical protein
VTKAKSSLELVDEEISQRKPVMEILMRDDKIDLNQM